MIRAVMGGVAGFGAVAGVLTGVVAITKVAIPVITALTSAIPGAGLLMGVAAAVAGMASSAKNGLGDLQRMTDKVAELEEKEASVTEQMAKTVTGFDEQSQKLLQDFEKTVQNMDMSALAEISASNTLQAFINRAGQMESAVSGAYEKVAKSAVRAMERQFNNFSVNIKWPSAPTPSVPGYAVGTTDAAPGPALVGEQGPELLYMRGGETVITADKTREIIREASRAETQLLKLQDKDQIWMERWLNEIVDAAASDTLALESSGTFTVTAKSGLNVRAGPGTDSKKLGALPCGEEIRVLSVSDGWASISYNGATAYVSAAYLKRTGSDTPVGNAGTGLAIECAIVRENWTGDGKDDYLNCGSFELDTVEASGPPSVITIKATSLPFKHRIRQTKQSRAWEEYCLSGIAFEMAKKNGMVCMFLPANDPYYPRVEQYGTSDVEFLSGLCRDAGISLKVTNKTLVLFDQKEYESRESVLTFRKGDGHYNSYRLSVSAADTQYQSCRVSYDDPEMGKSVEGVAYADDYDKDSDKNQRLEETRKVSSIGEAETLAAKLLRLHNKYERTARFTCPGNPFLTSGATVQLDGWGAWDGKHIITRSTHSVGASGYVTTIEARRTLDGY